jgi:hypothetical protein
VRRRYPFWQFVARVAAWVVLIGFLFTVIVSSVYMLVKMVPG